MLRLDGAVTAVQRVSSDFRLNPHFHSISLDGVFLEDANGELAFGALPCLTNTDVADVLQIARVRILALLRRKGVIAEDVASVVAFQRGRTRSSVPSVPSVRDGDPAVGGHAHQHVAVVLALRLVAFEQDDQRIAVTMGCDGYASELCAGLRPPASVCAIVRHELERVRRLHARGRTAREIPGVNPASPLAVVDTQAARSADLQTHVRR